MPRWPASKRREVETVGRFRRPCFATASGAILRVIAYALPHWPAFCWVFGLVIVYDLSQVAQPWLVKIAIDSDLVQAHPHTGSIIAVGLAYLVITGLGLVANFLQMRSLQYTGQRLVRNLRVDLFRHVESLSIRFFDTYGTGNLLTNVTRDTDQLSSFFTNFLLTMVRDGFSVILVMVAMIALNWRVALLSFVVIPTIVGVSAAYRPRLRRAFNEARDQFARMMGFTTENLAGMRMTQFFGQEEKQRQAFSTINQQLNRRNLGVFRWALAFNRTLDTVGTLAVALIAWVGGMAVLDHTMALGVLYAFITYIRQFFTPINNLTQQWNTVQATQVAAERIGQVFLTEPDIRDPEVPRPLPLEASLDDGERASLIVFDHVSFGYHPDQPVLTNIHFTIPQRAFVGFVGETGAGKSTLMALLSRFYEVSAGAIRIGGIDLRQMRQVDLRRMMAVVQQEVYLFPGTIKDNIRMFRADVSEAAVREAAEISGAHAFIRQLPEGYHHWVAAKGENLSMGQRQLLAFARALTRKPRILILDEATASLDSRTEQVVQDGLMRAAAGRTTLVIAHRLSTVRSADAIYVLDHGRIVEHGTHDALMQQQGHYASMVHKSSDRRFG